MRKTPEEAFEIGTLTSAMAGIEEEFEKLSKDGLPLPPARQS